MEQYKNIPENLKNINQWVCFKLEYNDKKGKADKIPKDPRTGYNAKANNPETWSDYQTAVNALKKYGFDGIGIEFAGGIFGVDLDNVINAGRLTSEAQDIIKTMDSYTEYSPSGNGIHIICRGSIPAGARRRGSIEMYEAGRFFTVTGDVFGEPKEIQERTPQAAAIHAKYLKRDEPTKEKTRQDINQSDGEIISKAMNAKNGDAFRSLWNGSTAGYDSHSQADLGLCNLLAYWTNGNAEKMNDLFKQSELYRPEKWDKIHDPEHGRTYGQMTIDKTLSNFRPYEKTNQAGTPAPEDQPPGMSTDIETLESNLIYKYLENGLTADIARFMKYKDRKTGFYNLDKVARGLYPGLYVIGAISSLGKTTFIHQLGDQLGAAGNHVLFFSMEQNRLEMATKSISRITAQNDINTAVSAIDIRGGKLTDEVIKAAEQYSQISKNISVIECNFNANINFIVDYTKSYIENMNVKPIVIIDYLQIIPASDSKQSELEKIDNIVHAIKKLQSENDLVVFVVSSMNRANYLNPVDFESFKASGGIEYTADVVWGLQLTVINDLKFESQKISLKEKRDTIRIAKKAIPRYIELICLKNRYGISSYSCGFTYDPRFDLFSPDDFYNADDPYNISDFNAARI